MGGLSMADSSNALIHPSRVMNRWVQLVAGIIAMMAIANLQYAWTLFTTPIQAKLHVSLVAVQWTFTLFVALETWLVPFEGYLVDIIGPRLMLGLGSIFVALGWVGSGKAESINGLYFWYALGGVGAGIVYGGAIGNALKWFPDHREHHRPDRVHVKDLRLPAHLYRLGIHSGNRRAGLRPVSRQASSGMVAT